MEPSGVQRRPISVTIFARASGSALLGLLLGGCGGLRATSCTDIGANSGIAFEFDEVLAAHPGESLQVEACVEDTCDTLEVGRHKPQHGLMLGQDLVTDDSPVPITLTVTNRQGDTVYEGGLTANPVKLQPNGPDCPPTAWSAQVFASGTHGLRQIGQPSD